MWIGWQELSGPANKLKSYYRNIILPQSFGIHVLKEMLNGRFVTNLVGSRDDIAD
jgi:hypothetical protein